MELVYTMIRSTIHIGCLQEINWVGQKSREIKIKNIDYGSRDNKHTNSVE